MWWVHQAVVPLQAGELEMWLLLLVASSRRCCWCLMTRAF
jgi:hypothetical protein